MTGGEGLDGVLAAYESATDTVRALARAVREATGIQGWEQAPFDIRRDVVVRVDARASRVYLGSCRVGRHLSGGPHVGGGWATLVASTESADVPDRGHRVMILCPARNLRQE